MRILITNDDGIDAPGLNLLKQTASQWGEVVVVAPDSQKSGISHQISFETPLEFKELEEGVFSVSGTPADCVRVAAARFGADFDWVLSGINDGANLGCDIFYSGTVAAAREACLLGMPAIAISQYRSRYAQPFDWQLQADIAGQVLEQFLAAAPQPDQWLNINLPDSTDFESEHRPEFIECEVDRNPLPTSYIETGSGWELHFKYSQRPRDPKADAAVCLGGNISVSRRPVI